VCWERRGHRLRLCARAERFGRGSRPGQGAYARPRAQVMHISAASEINNLLLPSLEALRVRLLLTVSVTQAHVRQCALLCCYAALL